MLFIVFALEKHWTDAGSNGLPQCIASAVFLRQLHEARRKFYPEAHTVETSPDVPDALLGLV